MVSFTHMGEREKQISCGKEGGTYGVVALINFFKCICSLWASQVALVVKKVLVTQSCPTLCDPMDCSPPGSSVHGILQARILERVAISSSRGLPDPGIEPRSPALQAVTI